jgi:hypothetical protein
MGNTKNGQKPLFDRILSKIPPKKGRFGAKFSPNYSPMQILIPTIPTKFHQWFNKWVTIQSLALWLQNGPKDTFKNVKIAKFTILKSPTKNSHFVNL